MAARSFARVAPKVVIASPSDANAYARPHACGFARSARIPGVEGFDRCLKLASVYRNGVFAFHVAFRDTPGWRLGLVIPKRYVRAAVARNAIKRRWREAFRRQRDAWAREFGGADLVIRMQGPMPTTQLAPRPALDASATLTALAERLRSRAGRRNPGRRKLSEGAL